MSAPLPKAVLMDMEDQIEAENLAQAHARLARRCARAEHVVLPVLLAFAATLAAAAMVAQAVMWATR